MGKIRGWLILLGCACLAFVAVGIYLLGTHMARRILDHVEPHSASSSMPQAPLICDKFDVKASVQGTRLELSLDTDLPDGTDVFVDVYRSYRMKGNPSDYSIDYAHLTGTVGDWRQVRVIDFGHDRFHKQYAQARLEQAYAGVAAEVVSISDNIQVRVLVHAGQSSPLFGPKNRNLSGKKVVVDTARGGLHIVEWKHSLPYPLDRQAPKEVPTVNVPPLEVGRTYRLSDGAILLSEIEPATMWAVEQSKEIGPQGRVLVLKVAKGKHSSCMWYQVRATSADGTPIGVGWVNGLLQLQQKVEKVD